jgi:hypothetical protein
LARTEGRGSQKGHKGTFGEMNILRLDCGGVCITCPSKFIALYSQGLIYTILFYLNKLEEKKELFHSSIICRTFILAFITSNF